MHFINFVISIYSVLRNIQTSAMDKIQKCLSIFAFMCIFGSHLLSSGDFAHPIPVLHIFNPPFECIKYCFINVYKVFNVF